VVFEVERDRTTSTARRESRRLNINLRVSANMQKHPRFASASGRSGGRARSDDDGRPRAARGLRAWFVDDGRSRIGRGRIATPAAEARKEIAEHGRKEGVSV
jgi:hypothetical protein